MTVRVLLIASEASLKSPAVMRELERTFQIEDERRRLGEEVDVLFPIRTDNYLFDGWNHHRKADVIAKLIGDASQWKDAERYQSLLKRLIRDLKD